MQAITAADHRKCQHLYCSTIRPGDTVENLRAPNKIPVYSTIARIDRQWQIKATGQVVDLHLERKKLVYKFSICIEHFSSLTSAKHHLKDLGPIADDTAWAPVISPGELHMIERFLDTELSFFHYLTRRLAIEELIDFYGDEQDLLSMYLTNGLCIDKVTVAGRKISFFNADAIVRRERKPRLDRTEVEVHGIRLSPMWVNLFENFMRIIANVTDLILSKPLSTNYLPLLQTWSVAFVAGDAVRASMVRIQ